MKLKRILSVVLALAIALSCLPAMIVSADEADATTTQLPNQEVTTDVSTEEPLEEEEEDDTVTEEEAFEKMKKVAEKDGLEMYFSDEGFINIALKDTKTGEIWFTNPVNALSKTNREKGTPRTTLASQLYVTMVDVTGTNFYANSQVSSYNKDTYEVRENEDGITIIYDFSEKRTRFKIPVKYSLVNGNFKVEILTQEIEEYGTQRITGIQILPHFGAGNLSDEGYIFVPDGSGSIINFNNGKGDISTLSIPLYGGDKSDQSEIIPTVSQSALMPVFGLVKNNKGYVAIIEGGDGTIDAAISTASTSHNYVCTTFNYRKKDTFQTNEGTWKATEQIIVGQHPYSSFNYSVEYMFLSGDDASYSGMARRYRQYLVDEKGLQKKTESFEENMPLFMEIYGELPRETSILGIPVTNIEALSSYKEVENIIKEASEKGMDNLVVDYIGWQKGGPNEKVPTKFKFSSKLGGKDAYYEMQSVAQEYNAKVFARFEITSFTQGGNGYTKSSLAAKGAIRTPIQNYPYNLGSGMRDRKLAPTLYLKVELYDEIVNKFIKSLDKSKIDSVALDTAVNCVYNDFETKEFFDIHRLEESLVEQYKKISEGRTMLMKAPNSYAMPYADYISSLPSYSSNYLVCDYEVPFVQMVLHSYVPYSSESISSSENTKEAFLKAIETGSALTFTITANSARIMKDSYKYNFLYCSDYKLWIDTASELYEELNDAMSHLQTVEMKNHERVQKDVYKVTYADGTQVVVNYSDNAVTVDEINVEANSYKIAKGGVQ